MQFLQLINSHKIQLCCNYNFYNLIIGSIKIITYDLQIPFYFTQKTPQLKKSGGMIPLSYKSFNILI